MRLSGRIEISLRRYYDKDFVVTNIDRRKCRIVPMRVLALGLGRTGTDCMSLGPCPTLSLSFSL